MSGWSDLVICFIPGRILICSIKIPHYGNYFHPCGTRNPSPCSLKHDKVGMNLPSFNMPIRRHFWNRQAWHAFLRRFVISHIPFAGHEYSIFPEMKNKWKIYPDGKCKRNRFPVSKNSTTALFNHVFPFTINQCQNGININCLEHVVM